MRFPFCCERLVNEREKEEAHRISVPFPAWTITFLLFSKEDSALIPLLRFPRSLCACFCCKSWSRSLELRLALFVVSVVCAWWNLTLFCVCVFFCFPSPGMGFHRIVTLLVFSLRQSFLASPILMVSTSPKGQAPFWQEYLSFPLVALCRRRIFMMGLSP